MTNRFKIADDYESTAYKALARDYRALLDSGSGTVPLDSARPLTRLALEEVVRQMDAAIEEYETRKDGLRWLMSSDYPPHEEQRGEKSAARLLDDADEITHRIVVGKTGEQYLAHAVRHVIRALQRMREESQS